MATVPMTRGYWSDKRPNGQPLEPGFVCWMRENEGENPVATYGRSVEEVLEKVTYTLGAAQAEIARRATATPRTTGVAPPPARTRMDANETMQAFSDMTSNPAKAGDAVTRLVEDATGMNLRQMAINEFGRRAEEWQAEHPEFYAHNGNIELLTTYARRAVNGDWASIGKELLTSIFHELQERGLLFEAPPAVAAPAADGAVTTFPGGSPVQRVEYPRGGRPGTGVRSTSFRATQTMQPRTPKYTDDDIRKMPPAKMLELIKSNDPDFAMAADRMYGARQSA